MFARQQLSGPPTPTFRVVLDETSAPPVGRLRVTGDLDLATAPQLADRAAAMAADGYRHLTLDLYGVAFCDVTGLNALLEVDARLRREAGRLVVHGLCRSLQRLLGIYGLTAVFDSELPASGPAAAIAG